MIRMIGGGLIGFLIALVLLVAGIWGLKPQPMTAFGLGFLLGLGGSVSGCAVGFWLDERKKIY